MAYSEKPSLKTGKTSSGKGVSKGGGEVNDYSRGFRNVASPLEIVTGRDHSVFGGGGYQFFAKVTGTGGGATGGTGLNEIPIIGNYLPYSFGSTLDLGVTIGCSGSGYIGLTGASSGATYNMITYAHPQWSTTIIEGATFGGIALGDFFILTGTSGNDPRECCFNC